MTALRSLFLLLLAVAIPSISGNENVDPLSCHREGFFPIPGSCREYYECYSWRGSLYPQPRECSPDTIFDAEFSTCRPVSRTNPSPCTNLDSSEETTTVAPHVEILSNDRNTLITPKNVPSGDANATAQNTTVNHTLDSALDPTNANNDALQDTEVPNSSLSNGTIIATEDALEHTDNLNKTLMAGTTTTTQAPVTLVLCDHMNFVSTYATLVIGTPFYRQSLAYEETLNTLLEMYNGILKSAKNNSLAWKNGDSIFAGITKTIQQASNYEREFNRKYEIYKQQIPKQAIDEGIISKLQEDIKKLQNDIKGSEDVLSITAVPQVRLFLENNIQYKQQEIGRKEKEIASSSIAAQELIELLHFIQYVNADSNEVVNLASHLQKRMSTLFSQYKGDLLTLQNFFNKVNESIISGTEEGVTFEIEIADNVARQQELELQKRNLNNEIIRINAEHRDNMKSIQELQNTAERKREEFNKKVTKICAPQGEIKRMLKAFEKPTPQQRKAACSKLLEVNDVTLNIKSELDQADKLLNENERKQNRTREILVEIDNANRELTQLLDEEPRHKAKMRELVVEMGNIESLKIDLLALSSSANDAIDSISVIDETLQEVNSRFEAFSKQFSIFISQVHSAETDEARLRVKAAIEQGVSELLPKIHQLELPTLKMCT